MNDDPYTATTLFWCTFFERNVLVYIRNHFHVYIVVPEDENYLHAPADLTKLHTLLRGVILMFTSCAGHLCFTGCGGVRVEGLANRHQRQEKGDEPNPSITVTKIRNRFASGAVAVRLVNC